MLSLPVFHALDLAKAADLRRYAAGLASPHGRAMRREALRSARYHVACARYYRQRRALLVQAEKLAAAAVLLRDAGETILAASFNDASERVFYQADALYPPER